MLPVQLKKQENQICPAKLEVNKKTTVKLVKSKPTQQRQIWLHGLCRNKNSEALALEVKEIKVGTTRFCGKASSAVFRTQGWAQGRRSLRSGHQQLRPEFFPLKISPTIFEEFSKATSWNLIFEKMLTGENVCGVAKSPR